MTYELSKKRLYGVFGSEVDGAPPLPVCTLCQLFEQRGLATAARSRDTERSVVAAIVDEGGINRPW
jgi:hypothetical protein